MGTLNNILAIKSSAADTVPVIQDSTGKEVGQACTAWVNFNGTNGTIRNSFNVSSVTRNSIGNYTITFATPMANANYTCTNTVSNAANSAQTNLGDSASTTLLTNSAPVIAFNGNTGAAYDPAYIHVAVFGGK